MKQGDIILMDAGYRPAVIISQTAFNQKRNLVLVCPITNNIKPLRFHVLLDGRTQTQGDVICEQVRVIDLLARKCKTIEQIPRDLLEQILQAVSTIITLEDEV